MLYDPPALRIDTTAIEMVVGLRLPKSLLQASDLLVHTLDISSSGAKIGALREWIEPGSVLIVQRRHTRAQCRVMWSHQVAPGEVPDWH
jgi:hypothetical protein